jgi:streptogramin lyase
MKFNAVDVDARRRIPSALPPVKSMFVDNDGRVWIGLRPNGSTQEWKIIGPTGKVLGSLTT